MSNDRLRAGQENPDPLKPDRADAGASNTNARDAGSSAGAASNVATSDAVAATDGAGLLSRGAVGFWFLGLGVLGLVRGWMRATRHGPFDADTITLLWLIGSALLTLMGALRVWRSVREGRSPRA